jgi:hypothetical protein
MTPLARLERRMVVDLPRLHRRVGTRAFGLRDNPIEVQREPVPTTVDRSVADMFVRDPVLAVPDDAVLAAFAFDDPQSRYVSTNARRLELR